MSYSYTNPSPTGLVTLVAGNDAAEYVISGMDATGLTAGESTPVDFNLWEAMHDPGTPKGCIARLRDGGLAGTILDSHNFSDAGDSQGGHQQQWLYSSTVTPSTNRLCVTIQQTNGTPQITSDTREFTVTQGGGGSTFSLAGTLPTVQSALAIAAFTATTTANRANGRIRTGGFVDESVEPVTPLPASLARAQRVSKAIAYPTPDLVDGRPT